MPIIKILPHASLCPEGKEITVAPGTSICEALLENHIEIELAGGHRMRISGSYDPEVLARLIRGLTA